MKKIMNSYLLLIRLLMNIKIVEVIKIFNNNNELLLEYPKNTLLDKIVDVWSIIVHYRNPFLFMVGKYSDNYDMRRLITHNECKTKTFISLFCASYIEKNGIAVLFDNDYMGDGARYISCEDSFPLIDNEAIRILQKKFKKYDIVACETNRYGENRMNQKINDMYISNCRKWKERNLGLGLFVPIDFFFDD